MEEEIRDEPTMETKLVPNGCESDQAKIDFFFANLRVDAWVSYKKFDGNKDASNERRSYRINRKVSS